MPFQHLTGWKLSALRILCAVGMGLFSAILLLVIVLLLSIYIVDPLSRIFLPG